MAQENDKIRHDSLAAAGDHDSNTFGNYRLKTAEEIAALPTVGEAFAAQFIAYAHHLIPDETEINEIGDLSDPDNRWEVFRRFGLDSASAYFSFKVLTEKYRSANNPSVTALEVFEGALAEAVNTRPGSILFDYHRANEENFYQAVAWVWGQKGETLGQRPDGDGRYLLPIAWALKATCDRIDTVDPRYEGHPQEIYDAIRDLIPNDRSSWYAGNNELIVHNGYDKQTVWRSLGVER